MWNQQDQRLRYQLELLRKAEEERLHLQASNAQQQQPSSFTFPEHSAAQMELLNHRLRMQAVSQQLPRMANHSPYPSPHYSQPSALSLAHLPPSDISQVQMQQILHLRQQQEAFHRQRELQGLHGTGSQALSWPSHHQPPLYAPQQKVWNPQTDEGLQQQRPLPEHSKDQVTPSPSIRSDEVKEESLREGPEQLTSAELPRKRKAAPAQQRSNVKAAKKPKAVLHLPKKPSKNNSKWLATLEELKSYKEEHGDCIVPRGYANGPKLASWVAEQRKQYKLLKDGKQSSITSERIDLLNELGFAWNAQEAAWARHMEDLKSFRDKFGHTHVPLSHPEFPKLGLWIKEQRRHYTLLRQGKQSHMTEERAAELDRIGFCWDTHEATWLERFRDLTDFKEKHGHCSVPANYAPKQKLSTWVHHQRRQYRKFKELQPCHITEDRVKALESVGFVWSPRDRSSGSSSSSDSSSSSSSADSDTTEASSSDRRSRKRRLQSKK